MTRDMFRSALLVVALSSLAACVTTGPTGPYGSGRNQPGDTFKDCTDCPAMVVIPPGSFRMGDLTGDGDDSEKPVHDVRIDYSFAAGKYEVTQAEWLAVMEDNPSQFRGDHKPVEKVSWKDASEFVQKLSAKTGAEYRLLSEAEWEYVARAGSTTNYPWGNDVGRAKANCHRCRSGWDHLFPAPAGCFQPNDFGVFDTVGNVYEWVADCWHDSYVDAPSDGSAGDEKSPGPVSASWRDTADCSNRVLRGGSVFTVPWFTRSSARYKSSVDLKVDSVGFRVARSLPQKN